MGMERPNVSLNLRKEDVDARLRAESEVARTMREAALSAGIGIIAAYLTRRLDDQWEVAVGAALWLIAWWTIHAAGKSRRRERVEKVMYRERLETMHLVVANIVQDSGGRLAVEEHLREKRELAQKAGELEKKLQEETDGRLSAAQQLDQVAESRQRAFALLDRYSALTDQIHKENEQNKSTLKNVEQALRRADLADALKQGGMTVSDGAQLELLKTNIRKALFAIDAPRFAQSIADLPFGIKAIGTLGPRPTTLDRIFGTPKPESDAIQKLARALGGPLPPPPMLPASHSEPLPSSESESKDPEA